MSTEPTRIVLGREQMPTPSLSPAPPPPPPDLPWWHQPPAPPPPPPVVHVHVDVALPDGYLPQVPDPQPGPRWWQRRRPGYTAACLLIAWPLSSPWAALLADVRDTESLAGAWVMAIGPLIVLAFADNVYRVAAAGAAGDLWIPKIRAACARILLLTATIATARALPLTTLVYAVTGVKP
ncbi:hypothetical protein AB0F46_21645 [Streptomyces sp. NPDC026665]|uniref:hypothetical protein n=1 Tax=Streptomyces sp. NPDC026665 TaxID=3154798 RepID=UPI0033F6051D